MTTNKTDVGCATTSLPHCLLVALSGLLLSLPVRAQPGSNDFVGSLQAEPIVSATPVAGAFALVRREGLPFTAERAHVVSPERAVLVLRVAAPLGRP